MAPLIIITDATLSGDDLIAIALLLAARPSRVKAIVAVSGNVWAEQAAHNVQKLLPQLGRQDVSVCVGTDAAARRRKSALDIELASGQERPRYLGALGLEPPVSEGAACSPDALFAKIAGAGRPDLLVLAPASVLAPLIKAHADFADHISRIYLMGGSIAGSGNTTARAEFNFWFDPEAAEALLASRLPIILLPLDTTRELRYPAGFSAGLDPRQPAATHVRRCLAARPARPVCDEALAALVLDPSLAKNRRSLKIAVNTTPGPDYGAVDLLPPGADRRAVEIIEAIDEGALWNFMRSVLDQAPAPGEGLALLSSQTN